MDQLLLAIFFGKYTLYWFSSMSLFHNNIFYNSKKQLLCKWFKRIFEGKQYFFQSQKGQIMTINKTIVNRDMLTNNRKLRKPLKELLSIECERINFSIKLVIPVQSKK